MASTQTLSLEIASFPDLPTPCFVPIRYRPGNLGTWSGHLAFANDLIANLRPALLVELGTHWGESYFTFCQSVYQNGIDCVCYAVDHWLGEPHAGHYGEEVYIDVQQFNDAHYRGFSYLLRTGFDEAREQFADESIDLLHIDGLHTYEAVSHDFQTWLPKVKPGGIILLHDIAVRHADFGVWRLWDELKDEFPRSFEFHHWWGLGILQKPGGSHSPSAFLDFLFHNSPSRAERIRRHYLMQTAYLENTQDTRAMPGATVAAAASHPEEQQTTVQVYPFGTSGYSEESSVKQTITLNESKNLTFTFPHGTGQGPLRIDPSDCVSVDEIKRIALMDLATGAELFRACARDDFKDFQFSESTEILMGADAFRIVSWSRDPYFILPPTWLVAQSAQLEITILVQTSLKEGAEAFQSHHRRMAAEFTDALEAAEKRSNDQIDRLRRETERLEGVLAAAKAQWRQEMQREVRIFQELLDNAEDRARQEARKAERLAGIEEELHGAKEAIAEERTLLEKERALRASMLQSKSWTLTKPLRDLTRMLKR